MSSIWREDLGWDPGSYASLYPSTGSEVMMRQYIITGSQGE